MPRRETQIFSLSMMDVISGAMGAFLIIMVVLMRYYKEDEEIAKQREEVQKQLEEIQRQIDEAIQQLQNTTDIDVAELIRRLKAIQDQLTQARQEVNRLSNDLQAARSRVNQLQTENQALQAQAKQLEQERQKLQRELDFRRPFLVVATWNSGMAVDVDLVVESNRVFVGSDTPEYFDPDKKIVGKPVGALGVDMVGAESGVHPWVQRDTYPGDEYKAYVVLRKGHSIAPTTVEVIVVEDENFYGFDVVTLDFVKRWELICILRTDDTGRTTARAATDAERREDRMAVETRMRQKQSKQSTGNRNDNRGGN